MNAKRLILIPLLVAVSVQLLHAQLVSGRFTTSFYTWQKFDTVGVSKTYLRAFQSVQLSASQGDFSLHTFLQGAANGTSSFGDLGMVRFYNLYLQWSRIADVGELTLGRQSVYAGVASGTVDGLRATARILQDQVRITGFGGAAVSDDYTGVRKNIHDNYSFGGQVVTTALPDLRFGVSYLNRREERDPYWALRARDTTFVAVPYYIANDAPAEQFGSADAYYTYGSLFSVYGRYDYDFLMSTTSRGEADARVNVTDALTLTGDFIYRMPRISYNSISSVFTQSSVREYEAGVEYGLLPRVRAFARLALVSYTDDKSHRWTLGVNSGYGSFSYSGSDGYAGQLQSVSLQGAYPVFNRLVVPTLGLTYASYRLSPESTRDNALSVVLGGIVRPMSTLSVDLQGQWLTNKILSRDVRLQAKASYWFAEKLPFFREEVGQ